MAIRGYAAPEVETCYQRARELCRELGDTPQLVPALHGLWTYHVVRAQHASAFALGKQVLAIGEAANDDGVLLQGNMEVGWSHYFMGELDQAREHLERVLILYDHESHSSHAFIYGGNPATSARGCLAQVLWLLGYVNQSLQHSEENLATLRSRVEHPFSVAFGLVVTATVRQFLGDASATRALADEALLISERHGLTFIGAMASILKGWVLTQEGELEQGLVQMRRGLAAQLATGAKMARPYWLCLIAEACRRTGAAREGLALIDEAESAVEEAYERDCPPIPEPSSADGQVDHEVGRLWEAEIHRVRGDLQLAAAEPSAPQEAEACYLHALDVARRQGARSLELRAAVSLSRLWQAEGRPDEARTFLAPIYEWFSEGLDTPDLREAAALMAELGASIYHSPQLTALSGGR